MTKIKIETDISSVYIVRTQPRDSFLSTLETVSVILATIEKDEKVRQGREFKR
jgi:DTW domain-containing protein YfiP